MVTEADQGPHSSGPDRLTLMPRTAGCWHSVNVAMRPWSAGTLAYAGVAWALCTTG